MKHARGFTLVEMLVVLALLALIALLVGGAISSGARSWGAAHSRAIGMEDMLALDRVLGDRLRQALPLRLHNASGAGRRLAFIGTENTMAFVAPMPEGLDFGAYSALTLRYTDEGRLDLTWGEAVLQDGRLRTAGTQRTVTVLENARSVSLRYFGRAAVGADPQWADTWQPRPFLPDLVEVKVLSADGVDWPPLRIRPRVTAPAFFDGSGLNGSGGGP